MITDGASRMLRWEELYHAAMWESDSTKLPPMLEDATIAVLDQIEITFTEGELEELNAALNDLRSRRREATGSKRGRTDSPDQTRAA